MRPRGPLLSGNEAIARGAWEAGVRLGAGYPGTPSTEILEALARLDGVTCEWAPNEKVALEVAVGASLGGARALATMKHVGVNVAADPLFSVAYMGVNGGLVIVSADDPGMHSSQNEQDNRLYARHARIPLLEPATPAEALDYTKRAFDLSEAFDTPVLLRTTTRLSHGSARVQPGSRRDVELRPYFKDTGKNVVLPAHGRARHQWIEEQRIPALRAESELWATFVEGSDDVAFIAAGVASLYVREAFPDAPLLLLGMTYPLPEVAIREFARRHARRDLYVVEELEPWLEEQVRALGVEPCRRTWPRYGELSPGRLIEAVRPERAPLRLAKAAARRPLPVRPPALCPGCSHRGAFHALGRMDAIVSGDIGCYTLGALAPLDAMDACMNMGASIGMAHGMEKVLPAADGRRVVSVIGDSTFYHSGVTGLMDVVYNGGGGTVVVLDNRTTAMTGHQDHPGTGCTLDRHEAPRIDIGGIARAVGVADVRTLDPYDLLDAWRTLDDATRSGAPSVLIAEKPCVLKEKTRFGAALTIDPDRCTDCFACTRLGCPAIEESDGRLAINALLCNGCTHCQQVCGDCNAGIDVALMLELVAQERMRDAFELVVRSNPLPAVAARVCPHPCEREVNAIGYAQGEAYAQRHPALVERFPGITPGRVSVRDVERAIGDWAIAHYDASDLAPHAELGRSVAVVGSGPAGLSAAWQLRRRGWSVTVIEADEQPGGILRSGIPGFRLERDVLDAELARFRAIGVDFRCGVRVGRDTTLDQLEAEFDAVIVAVGQHASRTMELPGAQHVNGSVTSGLAFLRRFNAGETIEIGQRVAVIGGGNTAIDCARAVRRLGAEVVVIYRRGLDDMPAIPDEIAEARDEGVDFIFHRTAQRVVGVNGRMAGLEHIALDPGSDNGVRRMPVPIPGTEQTDRFDCVILAIGEEADLTFLSESGITADARIDVNFAGATQRAGVFACGDAAFGHGTVSQAVSTGRRAAELAAKHLSSGAHR